MVHTNCLDSFRLLETEERTWGRGRRRQAVGEPPRRLAEISPSILRDSNPSAALPLAGSPPVHPHLSYTTGPPVSSGRMRDRTRRGGSSMAALLGRSLGTLGAFLTVSSCSAGTRPRRWRGGIPTGGAATPSATSSSVSSSDAPDAFATTTIT